MIKTYQDKLSDISRLAQDIQPIVLAAFLSQLFLKEEVDLTVVGGAAVQFYTQAAYVTHDLDAILRGDTKEIIEKVMGELGFKRTTTYRHFEHPIFDFTVEFPPSPVEIGSRVISKVSIIKTSEGPVRVVRIEDMIMDRIVAAVEWRDPPSLQQAKMMWSKNKEQIDQAYLIDFATKDGYLKALNEVLATPVKI